MLGSVVGAVQIQQFGIRTERLKTMGKARRQQQAATIAGDQVLGMPVQISRRVLANIHRHIPDFTTQTADQLGLGLGWPLKMQTTYRALLAGT